jgi:hypothetical protein
MINRKPMTTGRLFLLKPGDSFVVYFAQDDDPEHIVLDYRTQMVREHTREGDIITMDNLRWLKAYITDPTTNVLDTRRGYAYFFEA